MQRRIGLAQALINNPELILLDEPTSGLDPIGTAEIKELIRELRGQGKTIVLSGHLLADMQDICDRIAILHRGELKEIGRVTDLLTVQDVTQIKTRDLSEAAVQEIREVIARHGGELMAVDHPTTTLEELFLRIVRESDMHPGRRRVAESKPPGPGTPATEVGGQGLSQQCSIPGRPRRAKLRPSRISGQSGLGRSLAPIAVERSSMIRFSAPRLVFIGVSSSMSVLPSFPLFWAQQAPEPIPGWLWPTIAWLFVLRRARIHATRPAGQLHRLAQGGEPVLPSRLGRLVAGRPRSRSA